MIVVISDPKSGKSYQGEVPKGNEGSLVGKKLGDSIDGGILGADGYKLQITGGSDVSGFPMRMDVEGAARKEVILSSGTGIRSAGKGTRAKRTIRGSIISDQIVQINAKVLEGSGKPLEELFPKKDGEKKK
jgi:small subunit ribosomal protein S6e